MPRSLAPARVAAAVTTPSSRSTRGCARSRMTRSPAARRSAADDGSSVAPSPARTRPIAVAMYATSNAGAAMRPIDAHAASTLRRTLLSRSISTSGDASRSASRTVLAFASGCLRRQHRHHAVLEQRRELQLRIGQRRTGEREIHLVGAQQARATSRPARRGSRRRCPDDRGAGARSRRAAASRTATATRRR